MIAEKDGNFWLGSCGISSRVIKNNVKNVLPLVLVVVRFLILQLILNILRKFVPESIKHRFQIRNSIFTLLLYEFCFIAPPLIISLMSNIRNPVSYFGQKMYKVFCILFLFVIMICFALFAFLPSAKNNKTESDEV